MTIGEAIRAEREARGWSREVARSRLGGKAPCGGFAWLEADDAGADVLWHLLNLRRIGLDPIGRIVREEEDERRRSLLADDAPWRADPKGAAEAVTGWTWDAAGVGGQWQQLGPDVEEWVAEASELGHREWIVWHSADSSSDIVARGPCRVLWRGVVDASTALVEAVIRGDVVLPPECPGLGALTI